MGQGIGRVEGKDDTSTSDLSDDLDAAGQGQEEGEEAKELLWLHETHQMSKAQNEEEKEEAREMLKEMTGGCHMGEDYLAGVRHTFNGIQEPGSKDLLRQLFEGSPSVYLKFWQDKCGAIVDHLSLLQLCCEIFDHLDQSERVGKYKDMPIISSILLMWAQLVRDSRNTHDQLKRHLEDLAWVTPDEVEEGMIKAFGPH